MEALALHKESLFDGLSDLRKVYDRGLSKTFALEAHISRLQSDCQMYKRNLADGSERYAQMTGLLAKKNEAQLQGLENLERNVALHRSVREHAQQMAMAKQAADDRIAEAEVVAAKLRAERDAAQERLEAEQCGRREQEEDFARRLEEASTTQGRLLNAEGRARQSATEETQRFRAQIAELETRLTAAERAHVEKTQELGRKIAAQRMEYEERLLQRGPRPSPAGMGASNAQLKELFRAKMMGLKRTYEERLAGQAKQLRELNETNRSLQQQGARA